MVASEAVPFAKTGGLADVAGALPLALGRLGHRVTLVLPRYRGADAGTALDRIGITLGGRPMEAGLFEQPLAEGVRAVLIDCPELYDRDGIYGVGTTDYADNARRFGFLARAALELASRAGERPSIVHAHDWQAGLVPVYLKTRYRMHPALGGVATVFTVHNLAYQGLFTPDWLPALDLGFDLFTAEALEYWGRISLLKGGINFSEMITTVSRKYAEEIQTPEHGFGFEGIVARRADDLTGITNGIDVERWDPSRDRFLPEPFSATNLSGKAAAKREVLASFGLPVTDETIERPLVGLISRLVDQKGFDLLAALADELPRLHASFILLGTGEPRYQDLWRRLAARHPDRIGVTIGFDERLAHLIEAGADVFLMPSRFEPCGLNQMYSLRYGTVPVVRATGGLDDTVRDVDPETGTGIGFKFGPSTPAALLEALHRAIETFRNPKAWKVIQKAGMKQNHSWDPSAREYVKIYRRAARAAARAPQGSGGVSAGRSGKPLPTPFLRS